jgi:hypothetical protein
VLSFTGNCRARLVFGLHAPGQGTSPALGWSVTLGSLVGAHLRGSGSDDRSRSGRPPTQAIPHGSQLANARRTFIPAPVGSQDIPRTNLFVDLATNSLVYRPSSVFTLVTAHIDLSPRPLGVLSLSRQVALFPVLAARCSDTCTPPRGSCTGTVAGANIARVDFRAGASLSSRTPVAIISARRIRVRRVVRPTRPIRRFPSPPRFSQPHNR